MKKGFTLLEILMVVAAIGILAAIVIIAINPNRQLAQVRNAQRQRETREIYNALEQYLIDNGQYPSGMDNTYQEVCAQNASDCSGLIDLSGLVPRYLANIPKNPGEQNTNESGYEVGIHPDNNKSSVRAQEDFEELSLVVAVNLFGEATGPVPGAITDLSVVIGSQGNADLTWTPPGDNGEPITDYIVEYSQDNFTNEILTYHDPVTSSVGASIYNLAYGQTYQFRVVARNANGNGPTSNVVAFSGLTCDTDYAGGDVNITSNTTLSGVLCNIGTFSVASGVTVNTPATQLLTISADTVIVDGVISATGLGYAGGTTAGCNGQIGSGPAPGRNTASSYSGGGGGGHAGTGGDGSGGTSDEGGAPGYGSTLYPVTFGSGGAGGSGGCGGATAGGAGGGALKILAKDTFTVNGSIAANGQNSTNSSYEGGGGAGGSIWLAADEFAGGGVVSANGGQGWDRGGSGSGGRVAIYYNSKSFSGSILATPGITGAGIGAQGTIFEEDKDSQNLYLALENNLSQNSAQTILGNDINRSFEEIRLRNAQITFSSSVGIDRVESLIIDNRSNITMNAPLEVQNSLDIAGDSTVVFEELITLNTNLIVSGGSDAVFRSSVSTSDILVDGSGSIARLGGTGVTSIATIAMTNGGVLTSVDNTTNRDHVLDLVATDISISSGSAIDVSGRGYTGGVTPGCNAQAGNGPGGGASGGASYAGGGGGAYGGQGGDGTETGENGGNEYGNALSPDELGSGGGGGAGGCGGASNGGDGGGAVKLTVSGTLTVDGAIRANGDSSINTSYEGGGGSGGSVWLDVNNFVGGGSITANGGNGWNNGGSGGGGRIAIYYNNSSYSGTRQASTGSSGFDLAGAGIVYIQDKINTDQRWLVIENVNGPTRSRTNVPSDIPADYISISINNTSANFPNTALDVDALLITYGGNISFNNTINVTNPLNISGDFITLIIENLLTINGGLTVSNGADALFRSSVSVPSLTIDGSGSIARLGGTGVTSIATIAMTNGGVLTSVDNTTNRDHVLDLVATDISISSGSSIDVSGRGYLGGVTTGCNPQAGRGPGGGGSGGSSYDGAGGAGHGGQGGDGSEAGEQGGNTYGDNTAPIELGSGGGGGAGGCGGASNGGDGGGAVKLTVSGTLTVDGAIRANGDSSINTSYEGGGGSGGSVWLTSGVLTGGGNILVNGGNGWDRGGSGAGGRIAICATNNTYSGTMSANAGTTGFDIGANGSIYYCP